MPPPQLQLRRRLLLLRRQRQDIQWTEMGRGEEGEMGAMGWSKHSISTGLKVIKSLHFGKALDAAMKSGAVTKGRSME